MLTYEQARYLLLRLKEEHHTPTTMLSKESGIERMMLTRFMKGKQECLKDDKFRLLEEYLQRKNLLD